MAKPARTVSTKLPQYSRTFEGYCDALIKAVLDPDSYTMAWLKIVEDDIASGALVWERVDDDEEKRNRALQAVEKVGYALGFRQTLQETAQQQVKKLRQGGGRSQPTAVRNQPRVSRLAPL